MPLKIILLFLGFIFVAVVTIDRHKHTLALIQQKKILPSAL